MEGNQSKQSNDKSKMLEECIVQEIIKNKKIKEGSIFVKRYNVYNCFSHLIGKIYDENSRFRVNGVVLNKLNKRLENENVLVTSNNFEKENDRGNIVVLNVIKSSTRLEKLYTNYLLEDNKIWNEIVSEEVVEAGYFYTDNRYTVLFIKKINSSNEEQYQFLGLYRFIGYDKNNYIRKWEKCVLPNNELLISEDAMIGIIRNFEKE